MECTIQGFYKWLDEQGWPSEVILHPLDFKQVEYKTSRDRLGIDERGEYLWCASTRVRPTAPIPRILDVSKERLFV